MKWQAILFLMTVVVQSKKPSRNKGWAFVGRPLLHARPCKDVEDITISFEPGREPGEENQYQLHISETLPSYSKIIMKFDSQASVTLNDASAARISSYPNGKFDIRFFKEASGISMDIRGPSTGTVPYITSLEINTVEYCDEPQIGILDQYILGYQGSAQTSLTVPDDTCGRRKVQHTELITNGLPTKPGDWPWHVAIYRLEQSTIKYKCGGTLISKNLILTAAHCVTIRGDTLLPELFSVVLGKYNLIGGDVASQEKEVHEVIVHESYNSTNLDNDIALLKLKTEVTYNDYIQPACLWNINDYKKLPGGDVYGSVVGWGFDQTDKLSSQLRQASMPKIADSACLKSNPVFFSKLLNSHKFCAGYTNGTSACNGDSGGGFVVFVPDTAGDNAHNATGTWHLQGIVSIGVSRREVALCDPYQYVLFTDVSKYALWLEGHMK